MHMQVALDVLRRNQVGKPSRQRGIDLAGVLAQFRRYPGKVQRPVDILFLCRPPIFLSPGSWNTPYSLILSPALTARSRSLILCSLLPVKYWSAAPKESFLDHAEVHLDPCRR